MFGSWMIGIKCGSEMAWRQGRSSFKNPHQLIWLDNCQIKSKKKASRYSALLQQAPFMTIVF